MKLCNHCHIGKDESLFGRDKSEKDRLNRSCRSCVNAMGTARTARNPEHYRKYKRERIKAWRHAHPEEERAIKRKRYYGNLEQSRASARERERAIMNDPVKSEERRKKRRADRKYKMTNDPIYRFRRCMGLKISREIKAAACGKNGRTNELLGCSPEYCMRYIEKHFKPGMTWGNHGLKGWHIDHKRPIASFDLADFEQQRYCFHFTNLQPLWWYENLSKGAKI